MFRRETREKSIFWEDETMLTLHLRNARYLQGSTCLTLRITLVSYYLIWLYWKLYYKNKMLRLILSDLNFMIFIFIRKSKNHIKPCNESKWKSWNVTSNLSLFISQPFSYWLLLCTCYFKALLSYVSISEKES